MPDPVPVPVPGQSVSGFFKTALIDLVLCVLDSYDATKLKCCFPSGKLAILQVSASNCLSVSSYGPHSTSPIPVIDT